MLGKIEGRSVSEDEMAGPHHWCNEHVLWQTLGDGEGQGGELGDWITTTITTTICMNIYIYNITMKLRKNYNLEWIDLSNGKQTIYKVNSEVCWKKK